ncbi:MAG: hypothetical protein J2P41_00700 [Blastocatellia bacterium]|nr:hypothetical protein [Blastocatellia bacterium]
MSTRTITYRVCDGCHRTDREPDPIVIVSSKTITQWADATKTLDVCQACDEAGKFICNLCARVHDDAHPCDALRRRMEEAELPVSGSRGQARL